MSTKIVFRGNKLRMLYNENLNLHALGRPSVGRASHVEIKEPLPWWELRQRWRLRKIPLGQWYADMSPVRGPVIGPCCSRTAALAFEVAWLERNWLFKED